MLILHLNLNTIEKNTEFVPFRSKFWQSAHRHNGWKMHKLTFQNLEICSPLRIIKLHGRSWNLALTWSCYSPSNEATASLYLSLSLLTASIESTRLSSLSLSFFSLLVQVSCFALRVLRKGLWFQNLSFSVWFLLQADAFWFC